LTFFLAKVIRFGKLFGFHFEKSFPFWISRIACKGTKISLIIGTFLEEKFAKNS